MISIGDDVIVSGKVIAINEDYIQIETVNGFSFVVKESDIKSYRPYQPIPDADERRGN